MGFEVWFLGAVIMIAVVLFITEYVSIDITAIIITVLLMGSGIVSVKEGLSGFSNEAALTILALLILNAGLESTGVIREFSNSLAKWTGSTPWGVLVILMPVAAILSAFTNNTAVITVFLPVIMGIASLKKISPSKLLIPIAYISILGGLCTLIGTSTNLLVNSVAQQYGVEPFGFFEFTRIGAVLVGLCLAYFLVAGIQLLPERKKAPRLIDQYNVKEYLTEVIVDNGSVLLGEVNVALAYLTKAGVRLIKISDSNDNDFLPNEYGQIRAGDRLLIKGDSERIIKIKNDPRLKIATVANVGEEELNTRDTLLVEAVVGPGSTLIGLKIKSIDFNVRYDAVPLAVNRSGENIFNNIMDTRLRMGDTLLLEAKKDFLENDEVKNDLIVLKNVVAPQSTWRKWVALGIVVGAIALAAFGILPIVVSALGGCALMVISGCVKMNVAYEKVDWKVYFLVAGIIPLGIAIQNTGLDELIANGFLYVTEGFTTIGVIMTLFAVTIIITNFMANNATALLMSPIAISIAHQMNLDPHAVLLAIIFGASTSFFTPIGYHTLVLIYGPGKYRFRDFFVAGLPLTLLVWVVSSYMIYLIYLR